MSVELSPVVEHVLTGIGTAAMYSFVFYAKKRMKDDQKFVLKKFLATVLVGAAVGASLGFTGHEITAGTIESTLASYTGAIALTHALIQSVSRYMKRRGRKQK